MAVLGRILVGSAERLDLPDFLSIDSFAAADFKYLIQSLVGADKPYIFKGFDVIQPQDAIGTESISIQVAESVVYYPGAGAGSFYYGLPEGTTGTDPLVPELRKNAVNFVYLSFSTFDTARDSRAFWDPDQNGGDGGEFSQDINTESTLKVEIGVSVSSFPENTIPVCKISVGPSVIEAIQDARDLMFRLGTGGIAPDPFATFPFRDDPSSTYARNEPSTIMTSSLDANPFQGGDKNFFTLKEWMDVVMTRIKEITGDTYWYGTDTGGTALNDLWHDAVGSTMTSKGEFTHDETTPGRITWSEDIIYHHVNDPREIRIRANTIDLTNNEDLGYIQMERDRDINTTSTPVTWLVGANYVNGQVGAFENLAKGDWIKRKSDEHPSYQRVEEFYALTNLAGGTTTAALAQSVRLKDNYIGFSGIELGTYTKGEFLLTDIKIAQPSDPATHAIGGDLWWFSHRHDTELALQGITPTQLSIDITEANGTNAKCTSVGHGLIDKDRITITTGSYAGTFQVEKENDDVFYITTAINAGDEAGQTGFYAIIETAARQTAYGWDLESAVHGAKTDQRVFVQNTATLYDDDYLVNVRSDTELQVAIPSFITDPGYIDDICVIVVNVVVKTQFGTVNVIQGQTVDVGSPDTQNILDYIGMDSLAQTAPVYTVPSDFSSQDGYENYNGLEDDDLTRRVAQLTAMMAMRVQDRGIYIQDRFDIAVDISGTDLVLSSQNGPGTITIRKPGYTPDQVFNLSATIPASSFVLAQIDRNNDATVANLTVASIGSPTILDENNIIIAWRMGSENVLRLWNGATIDAPGTLNWEKPEDSQNKNVIVFNPGRLDIDALSGLIDLYVQRSAEKTEITFVDGSLVGQSSYFTLNAMDDTTEYYVWFNVDTLGVDPAIAGKTAIEVNITSGDTASVVTSAVLAAVAGPLAGDMTVTNPEVDQLVFTNLLDGPASDATDFGSGSSIFVACDGNAPDISLVIPGSSYKNIIDVDAINGLGTHIVPDGYQAWVRINRYAEKTFNTIATAVGNTIDGPTTGSIYITPIGDTPIDQDIFVLWTRVGDSIIESHKGIHPDGNIYHEYLDVTPGLPANANEIQGNVPANTIIQLPPDSRDDGKVQEYIVGSGMLQVSLEGQGWRLGKDYEEVGSEGCLSSRIRTLQELVVGDDLFFRIAGKGGVYFASDGAHLFSLQEGYDGGRFITVIPGQPVVIQGAGGKLLDIKGDLNVDGVIDPTALQFTLQGASPLVGTDAGLWVNTSNELMFQRGTGPTNNLTTDFLRRDGTLAMQAVLDAGGFNVSNLADPTSAQHATTQNYTETTYVRQDGTSLPSADINLNGFKLINVADPTSAQDAATKNYADTTFLKLDGTNPMAAILNMGSYKIENLAEPTAATDGSTKGYVDTNFMNLDGSNPMAASLNMNTAYKIYNLADPTNPQDAMTKNYGDSTYSKLDGTSPMAANLNMNNFKIINLAAPVAATDATNRNYTDTTFLKLDGVNVMAGTLKMGGYKIENVATPTAATDGTTKGYVDLFLKRDGTNALTAAMDAGSNTLSNVADPVAVQDAVTLNYGDLNYLRLDGTNTMSGNLDMGGFRVSNGAFAVDPNDFCTKSYVDDPARRTGVFVFAINNSGSTITAGAAVGLDATGSLIYASAATEGEAEGCIGILLAETDDGEEGQVQISGLSQTNIQTVPVVASVDQLSSDATRGLITSGDPNEISCQSFTENFDQLNSVSFWLKGPNSGSPDFDISVEIVTDNGLDEPDIGNVIATSDPIAVSALSQVSWDKETFTFTTPVGLTPGVKYWTVIRKTAGGFVGDVSLRLQENTDPYAGGRHRSSSTNGASYTGNAGDDAQFELTGLTEGALAAGEVFLSIDPGKISDNPPTGSGQVIFSMGVSSGPNDIIIRPSLSFINE